jgi:uncharacterized protein YjbI with pentapeptide repeats
LRFLIEAQLVQRVDSKEPVIDLNGAALRDVNLPSAPLEGAHLTGADLSGANLDYADLGGALLEGVFLRDAELTGANVTQEQLDQAKSLEGSTMPNRQKYEEWLKSKGSGEDEGERGP